MKWSDYFLPKGQWMTLSGRINRQKYFAHLMVYIAVSLPVAMSLWTLEPINDHPILRTLLVGNLLLICGGISACLISKRLHDLGLPTLIVIPMLIGAPASFIALILSNAEVVLGWLDLTLSIIEKVSGMLNTGIGIYLLLAPGERGPNKYGPDPLPAKDELLLSSVAER